MTSVSLRIAMQAALTLVVALTACQPEEPFSVPPQIIGFWASDAPRYLDRNLEIQADLVLFWNGPEGVRAHRIRGVEEEWDPQLQATLFRLQYSEEGETTTLPLYYFSGRPPVLRLRNQPNVDWRRIAQSAADRR